MIDGCLYGVYLVTNYSTEIYRRTCTGSVRLSRMLALQIVARNSNNLDCLLKSNWIV